MADRARIARPSVIRSPAIPLLCLGRRLGQDGLGVLVEQVTAAGTADPVILTFVVDLGRAPASGDDAERVRLARGEGHALARVPDLAEPAGAAGRVVGLEQD